MPVYCYMHTGVVTGRIVPLGATNLYADLTECNGAADLSCASQT